MSNQVKPEARILLIKGFKVLNKDAFIYVIIRGIKGIEHLGLAFLSKEALMHELKDTGLLEEVRLIIHLDEVNISEIMSSLNIDRRAYDVLLNTVDLINSLINELVKLITSNT